MKTILLLEDDKNLNRGITVRLQKEGYRVVSVFNIKEAEQKLCTETVDLIISDITLPDGDGMEFSSAVRKKSDVYLIYLTALDQEIDIVNGYDSGADDYITKPFSLLVLISKVNALMRRIGEKEGQSLSSGGVTLHISDMRVIKGGQEVVLSKRELQILKLFLEHPGQIVTKDQFLESIWDIDGQFVDENIIAVNLSRLKNKLEIKAITNVRGVGYIWTEPVTRNS